MKNPLGPKQFSQEDLQDQSDIFYAKTLLNSLPKEAQPLISDGVVFTSGREYLHIAIRALLKEDPNEEKNKSPSK